MFNLFNNSLNYHFKPQIFGYLYMILIFFFKHKQHETPIVLVFTELIKVYYPVSNDKIPQLPLSIRYYKYLFNCCSTSCIWNYNYLSNVAKTTTLVEYLTKISGVPFNIELTVEDGLKHVITRVVLGKAFIIFCLS